MWQLRVCRAPALPRGHALLAPQAAELGEFSRGELGDVWRFCVDFIWPSFKTNGIPFWDR